MLQASSEGPGSTGSGSTPKCHGSVTLHLRFPQVLQAPIEGPGSTLLVAEGVTDIYRMELHERPRPTPQVSLDLTGAYRSRIYTRFLRVSQANTGTGSTCSFKIYTQVSFPLSHTPQILQEPTCLGFKLGSSQANPGSGSTMQFQHLHLRFLRFYGSLQV